MVVDKYFIFMTAGWILALQSHPASPGKFCVMKCATGQSMGDSLVQSSWHEIEIPGLKDYPKMVEDALKKIDYCVLEVESSDCVSNNVSSFEATVIHSGKAAPTMLVPHGGPHTAYSTQYVMSMSFMVACGFNIITVNYRGSTGFGEDSLQSLPGRIGEQDVKDCMSALKAASNKGMYETPKST